jgi:capsule biosynthesis phosphatase
MKKIIIDLDHTICVSVSNGQAGGANLKTNYSDSLPVPAVIDRLKRLRDEGFEIVIHTSRNMRTFDGEVGKINVHTLPGIIDWLNNHAVPFDQIVVGKPWCGKQGFYVDDRAIRPSEFTRLNSSEIESLLDAERHFVDESV